MMNMTQQPIYIDVREPYEYQSGHVENALNIPVGSISEGVTTLQKIPKDSNLVVYCRSGARAESAKNQLQHLGYTNVENGINIDNIKKSN